MSIKYYDKSGESPQEKLLAGISPVDQILNGTSKNAISNKAVYNALKEKIEVTVDHLVYFYNKSEVYNKEEVRALIGAIDTLTMEVVSSLPVSDISTTTIYLLKPSGSSVYDEYVYINNAWVKIGTTDMDLSGYMTTAAFNLAIADYYTKAEIDAMIADYYTKDEIDDILENYDSGQFVGTTAEWNALPLADKVQYTTAIFTDDDDYVGNIVDTIEKNNMAAITSNAVAGALVDNLSNTGLKFEFAINSNGEYGYMKQFGTSKQFVSFKGTYDVDYYKNGSTNVPITNGGVYVNSNWDTRSPATFNSDSISMPNKTSFYFTDKIDFSSVKQIKVVYNDGSTYTNDLSISGEYYLIFAQISDSCLIYVHSSITNVDSGYQAKLVIGVSTIKINSITLVFK